MKAANDAGGKDNITVVYVEGERFAATVAPERRRRSQLASWLHAVVWLLRGRRSRLPGEPPGIRCPMPWRSALGVPPDDAIVVQPGESIAAALERRAGHDDPGRTGRVPRASHARRDDVRLVSRVPRGATLRLPGTATEEDAAVMAVGRDRRRVDGFRIVGDAATPLGTGVMSRAASVR